MNKVALTGKIKRIYKGQSGTIFVTIHCRDGRNSEFLDVVVFQTKFFERYFCEGMWISITGRLHKNSKNNYKQEVIAEEINFAGDAPTDFTQGRDPLPEELPQDWTEPQAQPSNLPT